MAGAWRSARSATRAARWRRSPPTRQAATSCRCATPSTCSARNSRQRMSRLRQRVRGSRRRRLDLLGLLQPRRGAPCLALDQAGRRHRRGRQIRHRPLGFAARLDLPLRGRGARAARKRTSPSRICAIPTASASGRPSRAVTAAARRWSGKAASRMPASPPASRGCRCPTAHRGRAVDVQQGDQASVLAHYRRALAFRRQHPALVGGAIEFLAAKGDVLAFIRSGEGERLLCVFNFAAKPAKWAIPARAWPAADHGRRRPWREHRGKDDRAGAAVVLFRADWLTPARAMRRKALPNPPRLMKENSGRSGRI